MPDQGDLFAQPTGPALRDEALGRVEEHADETWRAVAGRVLDDLIRAGDEFTTDEVWARIPPEVETHEPRALGALVMAASRAGRITRVGYRPTTRPEAHSRPIPIWRAS